MRIFLAIEIPQNIKEKLAAVQEKLRPLIPGVRWEKAEKLHLTLVFLGTVEDERVRELEEVVRKGVNPEASASGRSYGARGINVGLSGIGVFPSEKRPRVVLVETCPAPFFVGKRCGVNEPVVELQKRLAEALSRAGFKFARLSKPHVTLGRFRRGAGATRRVNWDSTLRVGDFRVKEVAIVESKLHPAGAIHTPIVRISLDSGDGGACSQKVAAARICEESGVV